MNVPFRVLKRIALLCKVTFPWFAQDLFSSSKPVKSKATSLPTSKSMTKAPLSLFDDDEEVSTTSWYCLCGNPPAQAVGKAAENIQKFTTLGLQMEH